MNNSRRGTTVSLYRSVLILTIAGWLIFAFSTSACNKDAGGDVKLDWFEYAPSMEAFAAGKVDAVMMTMGDALVTGAPRPRSLAILVT